MKVPQPFQYQGSKRALAPVILRHLPARMARFVEPFAGSAALSLACAAGGRAASFWLNDVNPPLAKLLDAIINDPEDTADHYQSAWCTDAMEALIQFHRVREDFNRNQDARLLLYLLARCVKGAVRYNSEGKFNQSADHRRLGTKPSKMRANLLAVSGLLRERTFVTSLDYRRVLADAAADDVVYMDPPYQGVCGNRDQRYVSGIAPGEFAAALAELNRRKIRYLVSYDGYTGQRRYGEPLPSDLDLTRLEVAAGRSSQATLLGRDEATVESLYLSRHLAKEMGISEKTEHFGV